METETMEQIIAAAEKRGWRMSNLSCVAAVKSYSCILERKKVGEDGFPVYASSELSPTPREALLSAWANAQQPIGNPRVDARRSGKPHAGTPHSPLGDFLSRNVGYRVRLEDAFNDLQKTYAGEDDGDEW